MDEEESVDIEFVEEEDDKDYDVSLLEGAIFIPNLTNFTDKYKVELVWYAVGSEPAFLVEDKGILTLSELIKPVRKLKPVP